MPNQLTAGQRLTVGQALDSPNRRYRLAMQSDGNLVLYQGTSPYWDTGTWNLPDSARPTYVEMQTDGHLVLYNDVRAPAWGSGVWGPQYANCTLRLQDDGNLVIYTAENVPIWASNTVRVPAEPAKTRIRVVLDNVYCGGPEFTEDVSGADHFYLTGAVTDGEQVAGVVTRPIRINDRQTVPFGEGGGTVFYAEVRDDRILKLSLVAFDEDAAKDWDKREQWVTQIANAVADGLKASGNPYAVGAGEILPYAIKATNAVVRLDTDDELGTHIAEFPAWLTPNGEHRQQWVCRGGSSSYSNWQYAIRYRIIKG